VSNVESEEVVIFWVETYHLNVGENDLSDIEMHLLAPYALLTFLVHLKQDVIQTLDGATTIYD
jgi:hypothetical protein